jgi:hypothetical protein
VELHGLLHQDMLKSAELGQIEMMLY